jgi:hypothetical protein
VCDSVADERDMGQRSSNSITPIEKYRQLSRDFLDKTAELEYETGQRFDSVDGVRFKNLGDLHMRSSRALNSWNEYTRRHKDEVPRELMNLENNYGSSYLKEKYATLDDEEKNAYKSPRKTLPDLDDSNLTVEERDGLRLHLKELRRRKIMKAMKIITNAVRSRKHNEACHSLTSLFKIQDVDSLNMEALCWIADRTGETHGVSQVISSPKAQRYIEVLDEFRLGFDCFQSITTSDEFLRTNNQEKLVRRLFQQEREALAGDIQPAVSDNADRPNVEIPREANDETPREGIRVRDRIRDEVNRLLLHKWNEALDIVHKKRSRLPPFQRWDLAMRQSGIEMKITSPAITREVILRRRSLGRTNSSHIVRIYNALLAGEIFFRQVSNS